MSKKEGNAKALEETLELVLSHDHDRIIKRSTWGDSLTFEKHKANFDRIFAMANMLKPLPYELLPDDITKQINDAFASAAQHFEKIDQIDVGAMDKAASQFESLGNTVRTHGDAIMKVAGQWFSYLAYEKGDVSRNIQALQTAIDRAEKLYSQAEKDIGAKQKAVSDIVQRASDIAGDKGVGVFTEAYNKAATTYADESRNWLIATGVVFGLAALALGLFVLDVLPASTWYEWATHAGMVAILIGGAAWCGKNYRISRHLQTINKHKADGLRTFLAFRDAAEGDDPTRATVLVETTRSIFSSPDTGFVSGSKSDGGHNNEVRIVDVARAGDAATRAVKSAS